jgi:hypothetical protein
MGKDGMDIVPTVEYDRFSKKKNSYKRYKVDFVSVCDSESQLTEVEVHRVEC